MPVRRPVYIDEIIDRLDKQDGRLLELGDYAAATGSDVKEIRGWLAEAGLNSTGEGRRRLNQLLERRKEHEAILAFLKRPVGFITASVAFISTLGWAYSAWHGILASLFK